MTDNALHPDPNADDAHGGEALLHAYTAKTERLLDVLALATLWIVVIPYGDFAATNHARALAIAIRVGVSVVYGIDITIRSALAKRHLHYLAGQPLAIASVFLPPVRVFLSIRLVRSVFRRGNLVRFLVAASFLVLNGALIVYFVERHAPKSNIHTFGESVWWSIVTVTTVGYGDFYPVTPEGRITACFIMGVGILTLAVVTAQVASSFVSQRSSANEESSPFVPTPAPAPAPAPSELTLADLERRLARIEEVVVAISERSGPR